MDAITITVPVEYAQKWVRGDADHDVLQDAIERALKCTKPTRQDAEAAIKVLHAAGWIDDCGCISKK